MTTLLRILKPDDFHVHFRTGKMMETVVPLTAAWCGRALVMPNTIPPILTGKQACAYSQSIKLAAVGYNFDPLMTIKIVPTTTPNVVAEAKSLGVIAGKAYPVGVTTNSDDGVHNFRAQNMQEVFSAMQDVGMVLCLHGETPHDFCLDREEKFLDTLRWLAENFPRLKIVLEHITTAAGIKSVTELPDTVAGTITVHHLLLTLDDVVGGNIQPHHFCKPLAKRPEDLVELVLTATGGNQKFFLGTDSAPHAVTKKECACGCAGVFTAPVALSLLASIFEKRQRLNYLELFTSRFGAEFYGLPVNSTIVMEKTVWQVPAMYGDVVPFLAGTTLSWKIVD